MDAYGEEDDEADQVAESDILQRVTDLVRKFI